MKKVDKRTIAFLKQLGDRIGTIRREKKITQLELGLRCNIEKPYISLIESGGTNPTIVTLKKIAEALDVPVDELLKF